MADQSICIGPAAARDSYLNAEAIVAAAVAAKADAIHPGSGFLSEHAAFAERVEQAGLIFIGPRPEHIRTMGDKIVSRRTAAKLGLPLVPGSARAVLASSAGGRGGHECGG